MSIKYGVNHNRCCKYFCEAADSSPICLKSSPAAFTVCLAIVPATMLFDAKMPACLLASESFVKPVLFKKIMANIRFSFNHITSRRVLAKQSFSKCPTYYYARSNICFYFTYQQKSSFNTLNSHRSGGWHILLLLHFDLSSRLQKMSTPSM